VVLRKREFSAACEMNDLIYSLKTNSYEFYAGVENKSFFATRTCHEIVDEAQQHSRKIPLKSRLNLR
jgi:hypothetical protein